MGDHWGTEGFPTNYGIFLSEEKKGLNGAPLLGLAISFMRVFSLATLGLLRCC